MSPEFADCCSISFEEPHGSAAVSFLQHLCTLSPQSKWAADRCTLYQLKQAEFHFKASAQLSFLVASWHALDFMMYLPSSEDNMRWFLFFRLHAQWFLQRTFYQVVFWKGGNLPQLIPGHCLIESLFLGCRPKGPCLCLLCCGYSWLDAYFLFDKPLQILDGFHMNGVELNWIC